MHSAPHRMLESNSVNLPVFTAKKFLNLASLQIGIRLLNQIPCVYHVASQAAVWTSSTDSHRK